MKLYPVNLVVEDVRCVVVGGGEVAVRKVRGLLDAGAIVTVISPNIHPDLYKMEKQGKVNLVDREYQFGDLEGAALVIAATDDEEMNEIVAQDAVEENVLANVADNPALCRFTLPAVVRRGDVTVAVGTGGLSPALARKLKEKLEKTVGPEYGELARILGELRERFTERGVSLAEMKDRFVSLIDSDLLESIAMKDASEASNIIMDITGERVEINWGSEP